MLFVLISVAILYITPILITILSLYLMSFIEPIPKNDVTDIIGLSFVPIIGLFTGVISFIMFVDSLFTKVIDYIGDIIGS